MVGWNKTKNFVLPRAYFNKIGLQYKSTNNGSLAQNNLLICMLESVYFFSYKIFFSFVKCRFFSFIKCRQHNYRPPTPKKVLNFSFNFVCNFCVLCVICISFFYLNMNNFLIYDTHNRYFDVYIWISISIHKKKYSYYMNV